MSKSSAFDDLPNKGRTCYCQRNSASPVGLLAYNSVDIPFIKFEYNIS